jgi:hypothetical protein
MSPMRTSRIIVFAVLAVCFTLILPGAAFAGPRVGIGVGFGYGPFYPYGFYGPWGSPYYGYAPYGPYGRPLGEVHIKAKQPDAQIFINGSYAGRAHDLKHFYLVPGTYYIEQRIGNDVQKERIYVLADRNVTLDFGRPAAPSSTAPSGAPRPEANPQPPPPPPDAGAAAQQLAPEAQRP